MRCTGVTTTANLVATATAKAAVRAPSEAAATTMLPQIYSRIVPELVLWPSVLASGDSLQLRFATKIREVRKT